MLDQLRKMGVAVHPHIYDTDYDFSGGRPFDTQRHTVEFLTENPRAYVLNSMGCVDAATEYLSPAGWLPIGQYEGGKVAQYHPGAGTIEFVNPDKYVKLPCAEMIRLKTTRGVDQLLSPEHRVLLANGMVVSADYVERVYGQSTLLKFRTSFAVTGTPGLPWTDELIRLQVAINADGHYPENSKRVVIRIKKDRKKIRLRQLLHAAQVPFDEIPVATVPGFDTFRFAQIMPKGFGPEWWSASQHQLNIIADEVVHWDGSLDRRNSLNSHRFSSRTKTDADFIQYAYSASGRRAYLHEQPHKNGGTDYAVHAKLGGVVGLHGVHDDGSLCQNVWREASPDGFKYCFMVPSTFLLLRRNGCIFATGNTGKTKAALWAFDFLRRTKSANKMLVVAPLSGLQFTWGREIFRTVPQYKYAILHGSRQKRHDALARDADIYVINHDGLEIIEDALIKRKDIDVFCIDELAVYRNKTDRSECAERVAAAKPVVWGMTGAPMPNAPTDVFRQAKIVTPHTVPKYYNTFRDATMFRLNQFKWLPRRDAVETALQALQPNVRFTLDDVIELPPFLARLDQVPLGPKQKLIYAAVKRDCYALLQSGQIKAANAGAVMSKLLQVSLGWVYLDDGKVAQLDNDARNQALLDILRAARNKVIVFVPFKHTLRGLETLLKKDKITVELVSGETTPKERDRIFNDFQSTPDPRALLAHPECCAHSITLTAADTVVWYGPITSAEMYDQACARIRRVGQVNKQLFLHLWATPVEKHVYDLLIRKVAVQDTLLKLIEDDTQAEFEGAA